MILNKYSIKTLYKQIGVNFHCDALLD